MKKVLEFLRGVPITARLSKRAGIPLDRLRRLALGADPTMAEVRMLASALRVDIGDLTHTSPAGDVASFLFRTTAARADSLTISRLTSKVGYSLDLLGPREAATPTWIREFERGRQTYEEAEGNARRFRNLFLDNEQLGPILNLPQVSVNELGILLFQVATDKIDGASAFCEGIPFIFLAQRFLPRMFFTLAHEIGHLIAHHAPGESFAVIDVAAERPALRKNVAEFYAHSFASCLLMPARGVALALQQIRSHQRAPGQALGDLELLLLSRIYGVSFYVAARRCEDLELLPRGGAASLDAVLRKKFGSAEKRAELAGLPPRPQLEFPKIPAPLLAAAIEKVRSGELSIGRASEVLGLSVSDLMKVNAPSVN